MERQRPPPPRPPQRPRPQRTPLADGAASEDERQRASSSTGGAEAGGAISLPAPSACPPDDHGNDGAPSEAAPSPRLDYSPLPWRDCFDECRFVAPGFCVYTVGDVSPSAPQSSPSPPPLLLLLHGGGHAALSWALTVRGVRAQLPPEQLRIVAFDARGHGHTRVEPADALDTRTLVDDALRVLGGLFGGGDDDRDDNLRRVPPLIVAGHSMGGAMAVHLAASGRVPQLAGLVVIDVVEGSALQALPHMQRFLASRRQSFSSPDDAIRYVVRAGHVSNLESARFSVPAQLAADDSQRGYTWRTPLAASERYWREWFRGMSRAFVGVRAPKMLVLAGHDRLDRELTIAQMQGKFQTVLLPGAGHSVHEDLPERVAATLCEFVRRNGIAGDARSVPERVRAQWAREPGRDDGGERRQRQKTEDEAE